jgi:hypothetical protein
MPEPRRRYEGRPSGDDELRKAKRQALEGMRRLNPKKPEPSVSPEITPGIYWEDIDVLLAQRQKNRRKKPQGGGEYA